jgi:hypothetical protein
VKLVLNIQTNVKLVMSTEPTHHTVTVLMDSSLIKTEIVKTVTSDVLPVTPFLTTTLQTVLFVLLTESLHQIVLAKMVNMMT